MYVDSLSGPTRPELEYHNDILEIIATKKRYNAQKNPSYNTMLTFFYFNQILNVTLLLSSFLK